MSDQAVDIVGMHEMQLVFEVVDALEISRESVQVPLLPVGEGAVTALANGRFEIVLPADQPLEAWLPELERRLTAAVAESGDPGVR